MQLPGDISTCGASAGVFAQPRSKSVIAVMSAARPLFSHEQTFAGTHRTVCFVPISRPEQVQQGHSYLITSSGCPTGELLAEMRTRFPKPPLATPRQLDW